MAENKHPKSGAGYIVLCSIIALGIFFLQNIAPLSLNSSILYTAVVLLTLFIPGKKYGVIFSLISTLFILSSFFLHYERIVAENILTPVIVNRFFSLTGVWAAFYVIRDVRNSEESASRSSERLDALFEHSTEGIIISGGKGEIVMVNPQAETQFGYKKDELLGKRIEMLIPERFTGKHLQHRKEYYRSPHARYMGQGLNLFGKRKNGSEFPVEVSLSSFVTSEGMFVVSFIIDITERKIQEEAIHKVHESLEDYSQRLKESNAELEQFAYISSHDLQEPLRKIQSFGDRLKLKESEHLSDNGKEYVDRMLNAALRMQNLINDLLAFSRVTSKARPFEKADLNYVLRGVLSDLEITIEKSGAKIEVITQLPVIDADPTQMRQVFQNLISNAVKFRQEGQSPVIKIHNRNITSEEKGQEGRQMVEIFFEDNGIGFDEKYTDRIFNIFQRLEGQKYEGSGIGLAICKKIAIRHGGNITAKSEPGKGSVFMITLAVHHEIQTL